MLPTSGPVRQMKLCTLTEENRAHPVEFFPLVPLTCHSKSIAAVRLETDGRHIRMFRWG
jgi:hypothetical protein